MASDEVFAISGPKHMMAKIGMGSSPTMIKINWDSDEHRRCVAACLVNGTYIMEQDGNRHRKLAPAWWESFHFRCATVLTDDDRFIFGAVFEYAPPEYGGGARRHPSAPRYVVAFRGTMPLRFTGFTDMHLNLKMLINRHHDCGRYRRAREHVARLLDAVAGYNGGGGVVWLAGHSLGASIALDVGRHEMDARRRGLPTLLFNPPHVSLAPVINALRAAERRKGDLYAASYVVKAALAKTVRRAQERSMSELFEWLAPWVPELYVHERDFVCQGFIDYFEQRQRMLERSRILRPVAEVAMKMSFRDMWVSLHSNSENGEEEPRARPHLLPSARLWKTSGEGYPHGLRQWWQPDSRLKLVQTVHRPPAH